ncbi:MAG: acetyl/propionyl/methylcrotonyl-CoA carboxylase subunit alpha [Rhodospirillales bacterium]|nr:MAG: acetyl/propionyl/methylcrotonyl-CoA carboxylase subunit alpha [Rhodospirillales bacterium]
MFETILIANRGEIACRIIRTARRLGIRTIAVYSDADAGALHVAAADAAYRIGPAPPQESYLRIDRIIEAAKASGAGAIHPGYGFLSENAELADACREHGIVFIGPPAAAIRAMGSKSAAKAIMETAGVPVVPGYHGANQDPAILSQAAVEMGFPVLIKAVAGGGGKGMRIVERADDFAPAALSARREATAAFGDDALLIEKYLVRPRHVEMQVFADQHGQVVHLFERDCSVQRRHQKIIEEAPAPGIDPATRRRLGEAAIAAARAIAYQGAGTVEFLLDETGDFYFMEMNTRLQVEHPVTEMITGIDLVEWQFRIAGGEPLPLRQDDIQATGHAFEARIYAEDPDRDFLPAPGVLDHLRFPEQDPHVRIDTGVRQGDDIGIHYDPLIAKLAVWDGDRTAALRRLRAALAGVQVVGPTVNVGFLASLAAHPAFAAGVIDTGFIPRHHADLFPGSGPPSTPILAFAALEVLLRRDEEAAAAAAQSHDPHSPWHLTSGWRLNDDVEHVLTFRNGDARIPVTVQYRTDGLFLLLPGEPSPMRVSAERTAAGDLVASLNGARSGATVVRRGQDFTVITPGGTCRLVHEDPAARAEVQEAAGGSLKAPMPGRVVAVMAKAGDRVAKGTALMILEAMKMEHAVTAPGDGTIASVLYEVGEQVPEGADLIAFDDDSSEAR